MKSNVTLDNVTYKENKAALDVRKLSLLALATEAASSAWLDGHKV